MTIQETALAAAQGIDTEDFLNHIAWDEVILPRLRETREALTRELVQAVLNPAKGTDMATIAGKVAGIDYTIALLLRLVREGKTARTTLQEQNISFA